MYICNKCGEKIDNPNIPCPNCGLVATNGVVNSLENTKKFPINLFVAVIAFALVLFSVGFMQSGFSTAVVTYDASNFSLEYDNYIWSVYDVNDEIFALVSNNDSDTYIQIPNETTQLGIALTNEESISDIYKMYSVVLNSSTELNYNNVSSNFEKFYDTNYYYISADYISYSDNSVHGKLYVILNSEGEALNILINLGTYSFSDIEDDVLDVLKSINM